MSRLVNFAYICQRVFLVHAGQIMDFLHRNPFVRLLLSLVVGILVGNYLVVPGWFLCVVACAAVFLLLVHGVVIARKRPFYQRFRWLFGCAVFLLFVLLGIVLTEEAKRRTQVDFLDVSRVFYVEIADRPEEKPRSVLCRVNVIYMADSSGVRATKGQAVVYLQKDSASLVLRRGDCLFVSAVFGVPVFSHNPESFNYAQYLQRQGIAATAYVPQGKWKLAGHNDRFSVMDLAERCQQYLLSIYRKYDIRGDNFGVLAALTLGYKESLSPDIRQSFSATGAMHILAVSGLHTGVVFVVLNWIFSLFLGRSKRFLVVRTILIITLLWMYAFITGLSPSVLRATIMFSFVRVGMSLERSSQIYNTIAVSAFLLLLHNPFLLFNVGFQLSYSAVVAIILFQPSLSRLCYVKSKPLRWLWDLLCVSFAAQLGTAPWTLYYFNQFSNYFLLTNILAIPMASIIIYTAVGLLVLSPIGVLGKKVAGLLNAELSFLNTGIRAIEKLPHATGEVWISVFQVVLLFGCIALATVFLHRRRAVVLMASLGCLLLFFMSGLYRQGQNLMIGRLVVYADNRNDIVQLTHNRKTYIYTDSVEHALYQSKGFRLKYKLENPQVFSLNGGPDAAGVSGFVFNNQRFLLLRGTLLHRKTNARPLQVDYALVGNIGSTYPEEIFRHIEPKHLIVLSTCPHWKVDQLERLCQEREIGFYDVRTQGAWSMTRTSGLSGSDNNR